MVGHLTVDQHKQMPTAAAQEKVEEVDCALACNPVTLGLPRLDDGVIVAVVPEAWHLLDCNCWDAAAEDLGEVN